MAPYTVAIVGAGLQGLNAAKNLLELNASSDKADIFAPTILDARTDGLGGTWRYTRDPNTLSALPSTLANVSRWRNCFSDFSMAEAWEMAAQRGDSRRGPSVGGEGPRRRINGIPVYLSTDEQQLYLEMYAEKFQLEQYVKCGVKVLSVTRNEATDKWKLRCVYAKGPRDDVKPESDGSVIEEEYDKVILATGANDNPSIPNIEGLSSFKGKAIHSIAFKDTQEFKGQNVMVVGFSNSAADIANDLVGTAKSVLVSHRHGNNIVSRVTDGKPADTILTRRLFTIKSLITSFFPIKGSKVFDGVVEKLMNKALAKIGGAKPEWRLSPAPSSASITVMCSENFLGHLQSGAVKSVHGIAKIAKDGRTIELLDGTSLNNIDAIVFATGYANTSNMELPIKYTGSPPLPYMYQNVFLPEHPTSFATATLWQLPTAVCDGSELITMSIAQVFSGRYTLHPYPQLQAGIEEFQRINRILKPLGFGRGTTDGRYRRSILNNESTWRHFLNDAAGTGLNKRLGWGPRGWWFWFTNFRFCSLLQGGVNIPASYRLYAEERTGRKPWPGARAEIEKINAEFAEYRKQEAQASKKLD